MKENKGALCCSVPIAVAIKCNSHALATGIL